MNRIHESFRKRIFSLLAIVLGFIPFQNASASARAPYRKLSRELIPAIQNVPKATVAILKFPYSDGHETAFSALVAERLTTQLVGTKGVRVVERSLIEKLLAEQHLSQTGEIDLATVQNVGRFLGANIIVSGTLIEVNTKKIEINTRAILTDSGELISASQIQIRRIPTLETSIPKESPTPTPSPITKATPVLPVMKVVFIEDPNLLYRNNFEDGGLDGDPYPKWGRGTGQLIDSAEVNAAFNYQPRVVVHADGSKGIRFPTKSEAPGGYDYSMQCPFVILKNKIGSGFSTGS